MKKMLINARQPEEVRIATTENGKLLNIDIESIDYEQKKANIYKGIVTRVEPSLNAAFISYGEKRNGFLPFKEIAPEYFKKQVKEGQDVPLTELLDVGQEIIVQINKEERGTKGAALSTYITLAGCYLVLMPNNPEAGGISRRIEGNERQKLKELFDSLDIPKGMGVIIRTAGVDRQVEEMQWDLSVLLKLWSAINQAYKSAPGPFLIHSESDITVRAIRDHLKDDIEEIIVDSEEAGETLKRQLSLLRPDFVERVKIYNDTIPLFSKEQIESRIEEAYKREVILPSGGSIVIDAAEALTAIDINSAKATRGDNIEETAYFTNLEAAEEIARQLRLRDIGGLIVVDFIDMQENEHQRNVEHALIDQLAKDRAKVQMTRISRFGLVEISRQRLQSSLGESATISCPRCEGQGIIRSVPSLALSILRLIKEEAHKEKTNEIRVQLPISVATYLLNEKRDAVKDIESELDFKLVLIPNPNLETPHYYIQRIWGDNYVANKSSYNLIEERKEDSENYIKPKKTKAQQPLVKSMTVEAAPKAQAKQKSGLFKKIWNSIFATSEEVTEKPKASKAHSSKKPAQKQQGQQKKRTQQQQQRHHSQQKQDRDHSKDRRKSQQYGGSKGRSQKSNQTDGDRRSHSARSNQRNNTRPNLYKSEDVVDVQIASTSQPEQKVSNKDQSKDVATKAKSKSKQTVITSADALVDSLNVAPLKFETTSKLIKDPKSRISSNVEQILKSSDSQSSMQQIETQSTPNKVKYLKFEYVDLAQLKREQLEKEEKAKIAKREAQEAKREAVKAKKAYDEAQKLKAEEEQAEKYQKTDVKATEAVAIEDKAKQQDQATQQTAAIQSEEQKQMAVTSESFAKADENSEAVISIDVSENVSEFDAEVEIVIDYPEDKLEQSQVEEQELVVQASSESLEEERVEASDIDDHAEVEIVETDSTGIADDEKTEIQSAVEESIEVTEEEHLEEDDEEPVVPAPQIQAEIIEQVTIETKPQIVIEHEVKDQRDDETTVSIEVSETDVEEDSQKAVEETSNEASSVIEEKDLEQEESQKLETEHVVVEEVKKEDKEHHDAKSKKDEASASKKRKPQQQRRGGGQKKHHRGGTQQAKGHSNQQNKKHSDDDAPSKKSSHHKKDSNKEHQQKKAKSHHKKQHDENKHSSTKDNQSNTKKEEKEES
ncbi:Rne/Rng family ribonuclease [Thiotrichales bacterium 19X7-9]|nr:Rne/Rng family ribonuclease [Thiotrichales bacterium 19X7-9]